MCIKLSSILVSVVVTVLSNPFSIAQSDRKNHTVDFESFEIGSSSAYYGPTDNAVSIPGNYGNDWVGTIDVGGVQLTNSFSADYGSWSGFAVSKDTDTQTEGWLNQFSSITGSGADGSQQYAVAFGYHDTLANSITSQPFDSSDPDHLRGLPSIYLPEGSSLLTFDVTNTTYAALSMERGDGFAKNFGGISGLDPDFFQLNVYGMDANGNPISDFTQVMLADFRFQESEMDFILRDWLTVDVTSMAGAASFHFNLVSSDSGNWGMNTPAYFALDNLNIAAVPEPTTLALCGFTASIAFGVHRSRTRRKNAGCKSIVSN